jgi:hypothetical protein
LVTGTGQSDVEAFAGAFESGWKALAIWRVLRRLWSRISGTSGTGGDPYRSLAFVGEHVEAAGLVVLECGEQWVPPGVGEVLSLVDDDGVEPVSRLQLCSEFSHLKRKVVFPELGGLVTSKGLIGTLGCAPKLAEVVKLADVGRLMASVPVGGDALEVGSQIVRVADERDTLALSGEPTGLLDGEESLAAARSPADLDAVEQLDGVEDDGLVFGERVGDVLVGQRAGDDAALR